MKVLVINPNFKSGLVQYSYSFCRALNKRDEIDVALITQRGRNEIDFLKPEFKVYKKLYPDSNAGFWGNLFNYSKNKKEIIKAVAKFQPDIIHLHGLLNIKKDAEFINYLQNKGVKKIKIFYTAHNILPHGLKPQDRKFYSKIYNSVDHIVVHAQKNRDELLALFNIPNELVSYVKPGNFIVVANKNPELSILEAKSALGLEKEDFCLLFFGRVLPYRGLETLLKAMLYLKDYPKIKLVVAGEMHQSSVCNDLIDLLKIRQSVSFHLQYIPIKYLGQYFYASDIVVLPYRRTYQSQAAQMAFAFSRGVLSTKTGGVPEIIKEDVNGWLVSPDAPKKLATKILELYKKPRKEIHQVGQQAYKIAKKEFDWKNIAEEMLKVYQS